MQGLPEEHWPPEDPDEDEELGGGVATGAGASDVVVGGKATGAAKVDGGVKTGAGELDLELGTGATEAGGASDNGGGT